MILTLMVYGAVATGLLLLGGLAVEVAMAGSRLPRRLIWSALMALSVALIGLAGLRVINAGPEDAPELASGASANHLDELLSGADAPAGFFTAINSTLSRAFEAPARLASRVDLDDAWLSAVWAFCSVGLIAIGFASTARYRRLRRGWPVTEIEGRRVRLSPRSGPAVMGLLRPEIVVPRWLIDSPIEARRLVLAHEQEHLRARDGLLLMAGWSVVALAPWNPALWWMLFRLRLAIEIDCDRRVLAAGVEKHRYGSLLIDLSAHGSGLSLAVPALAGFPSTLERRLVAMTTDSSRRPRGLRALAATLGGAAVLVACGSEMPTAAEIEALDVAQVESRARVLGIDATEYYVDGVQVSAEQAKALAPEQIASVEVRKDVRADGTAGAVHIQTQGFREPGSAGDAAREIAVVGYGVAGQAPDPARLPSASSGGVLPEVTVVEGYGPMGVRQSEPADEYRVTVGFARPSPDAAPVASAVRVNADNPLFIIDGVAASDADFNRLVPASIQSITVLKDASATQYTDPRARNGVVLVTTKGATP